jgi:hypothetical protein
MTAFVYAGTAGQVASCCILHLKDDFVNQSEAQLQVQDFRIQRKG